MLGARTCQAQGFYQMQMVISCQLSYELAGAYMYFHLAFAQVGSCWSPIWGLQGRLFERLKAREASQTAKRRREDALRIARVWSIK